MSSDEKDKKVEPKRILVTGDIVLDCHLYGGVKTAAASLNEPGTIYDQHLGGAALTYKLLKSTADAQGTDWDQKKEKWEKTNEYREKDKKKLLPQPDELDAPRPAPSFTTCFGLDDSNLEADLPTHHRSYGVWTAQPIRKGSKELVWRVIKDNDFGYGPAKKTDFSSVFKPNTDLPSVPPALTLIDDGGIMFRHSLSKSLWPTLPGDMGTHYLLKMSWPLCRCDLWEALEPVRNRLIVVVGADDIRREDAQINSQLSWEQCAEHTVNALLQDHITGGLLKAAHVIVSFRSAGALWVKRSLQDNSHTFHLLFDPFSLEGDFDHAFEGTVYGFQTCLAAGIAHHLMADVLLEDGKKPLDPFNKSDDMDICLKRGISSGLNTRRLLLELGHGTVGMPKPGFPFQTLGKFIASPPGGFETVTLPNALSNASGCQWSILSQSETIASAPQIVQKPLIGLAQLTARYGTGALSHVPALRIGKLFTADRSEIESFRTLQALIRFYEDTKVQKKPLSIGVFGPPGAGKSFGVKALAQAVLTDKVPFLEFNLSQFKNPEELVGAFHRVRDAVLGGITPVAFWDEFDSQHYKWLQYLLAPMQDGSFQEGQITHPIGKCIFIFAGGTSPTIDTFGVLEPKMPGKEELDSLESSARAERKQEYRGQMERYNEFKLLKGPDFISRLHGFLNVLGPNERTGGKCPDVTWPIRRALLIRGMIDLKDGEELDIDSGLLNALLAVPEYCHGVRSLEKIVFALMNDQKYGRLNRSALPPLPLLERETKAEKFQKLLTQFDTFKNHPDLEALAAIIHRNFLKAADRSTLDAEMKAMPHHAWTIHPAIMKVYDDLSTDMKASNRAAARRIPDHLALIDFLVVPQQEGDDGSWKAPLEAAIDKHLDRVARAEHLGWCAERIANGWTYAKERDNDRKLHPLIVPWSKLPSNEQDKDRSSAKSIVNVLEDAKYKAVPISNN